MRKKLIVGNWKMHGGRDSVTALLASIAQGARDAGCDVAVCPPFPWIALCAAQLDGSAIAVGAQDVSEYDEGPHTGDVSARMLRDAGCDYVLVGHSERRAEHRESDATVARKTRNALHAGLRPIVCLGETIGERQSGATGDVLVRQLRAVVDGLADADVARLVIAYEPVWAIGSGIAATPEVAQEAHATLRRALAGYPADIVAQVRILYGGSMKPDSAPGLLAMPDIDGGLVGGASLDAAAFLAIVGAAVRRPGRTP